MKKIYLSGKISGLENYKEKFAEAAVKARDLFDEEVEILNPAELPIVGKEWADFMIRDLMFLKDCDAIVMLDNWEYSVGANVEHFFAKGCGIEIYYL